MLVDNDALLAVDLRLSPAAGEGLKIPHQNAVLIGVEDGGGFAIAGQDGRARYLPVARGRVDWLGRGELEMRHGRGAFGRAVLVDIRDLPKVGRLERTFGDRVIWQDGQVCIYEEIIGPLQVRPMHNHGPRLVVCLSDIDLRNTLPGDKKVEVRRQAGAVTWNGAVITHEVFNVASEPFWCICIEHA